MLRIHFRHISFMCIKIIVLRKRENLFSLLVEHILKQNNNINCYLEEVTKQYILILDSIIDVQMISPNVRNSSFTYPSSIILVCSVVMPR